MSTWAIYAVGAVAMCHHFHVRKNKGLGLASVIEAVTGCRANGPVGRLIDLLFMLCMFGALTISLVLTATTFSRLLSTLTGIPDTFTTQLIIILAVSVLFTLSSWVGMDGGMKRLSHMVCWGVVALTLYSYLVGPTQFITSNTLSSMGLMLTSFVDMSLFTDPMGNGKFTREWTVFYWLWWISYAPGVALFVTRVSRGRTIREVILAMLLDQLPAGRMVMTFFLLVMAIFLAAHMDAVGYAVSATCTRDLAEGEDPAPSDRLFWCIMLTLVPLAMICSKAPLNTMKTAVIVTAIPFLVVLLLKAYGLLKWLREDYGNVPGHLIEERHGSAGTVVVNKQPVG